jgi:hydrogenase-1 operon protein HyaF
MKPFPIPVLSELGPGMLAEDETLDYVRMPSGMQTYRAPALPEPEHLAGHDGAVRVLHAALAALRRVVQGGAAESVSLAGLAAADLALVNQVLGEGEVSAQVLAEPGLGQARVQESVFAGVWRVFELTADGVLVDRIELAPLPPLLLRAAREDFSRARPAPLPMPAGVMNAQSLLTELEDQRQQWRSGLPAHVVNLTLLPLVPDDIGYLDHVLGTGRVLVLSRGYGNCRITNTRVPSTWRVVYYNSQDHVILNTVEVTGVPEVACAAPEDLADSLERLAEVLAWVAQG